eukprot:363649-Chlamydomonas_euryale.AAC.1
MGAWLQQQGVGGRAQLGSPAGGAPAAAAVPLPGVHAVLNFVDLAGSERMSSAAVEGVRTRGRQCRPYSGCMGLGPLDLLARGW